MVHVYAGNSLNLRRYVSIQGQGQVHFLTLAQCHSHMKIKTCFAQLFLSALNDFGNRWCKRESVECNAMKEWKLTIFNIVDKRIKFYSQNTNLLPPKPKSSPLDI